MAKQADTLEKKVVAFAEQLGRVVGTVQAKAEGWLDREALNTQLASVRDGAADLLEQLSGAAATASVKAGAVAKSYSTGRSGGIVDAPGKKHRKPAPRDPRSIAAVAKAANLRAVKPSMKTGRLRGRG